MAQDTPPQGFGLLKIRAKCIADDATLITHIESALARNLREFADSPPHNGEAVLVGSGPSVRDEIGTIRKLKRKGHFVMAVKSAHDYLISHGVIPHIAIAVDPQAKIKSSFKLRRKEVTYFIASQCHPEVFDYLQDYPIIVWHLHTGKDKEKEILKSKLKIGGGSTSGLRGLTLSYLMGFRKLHLFGYDSCIKTEMLKVTGESVKGIDPYIEEAKAAVGNVSYDELFKWICEKYQGKSPVLRLFVEEREFWADKAMSAQATEMEMMLNVLHGVQIKVYGDGLIQHLIKRGTQEGRPDCKHGIPFSPVPIDPTARSIYEVQQCGSSLVTIPGNQSHPMSRPTACSDAQASP